MAAEKNSFYVAELLICSGADVSAKADVSDYTWLAVHIMIVHPMTALHPSELLKLILSMHIS